MTDITWSNRVSARNSSSLMMLGLAALAAVTTWYIGAVMTPTGARFMDRFEVGYGYSASRLLWVMFGSLYLFVGTYLAARMRFLSIPFICAVVFVFMHMCGSAALFVSGNSIAFEMFAIFAPLCMAVGLIIGWALALPDRVWRPIKEAYDREAKIPEKIQTYSGYAWMLFLVAAAIYSATSVLDSNFFSILFTGEAFSTTKARMAMYDYADNYHYNGIFEALFNAFLPFVVLCILVIPERLRSLDYLVLTAAILISLLSGQRWPATFLIIMIVLMRLVRNRRWDWNLSAIVAFGLGLLVAISAMMPNNLALDRVDEPAVATIPATPTPTAPTDPREHVAAAPAQPKFSPPEKSARPPLLHLADKLIYRVAVGSHGGANVAPLIFGVSQPYLHGKSWAQDLKALVPGPDNVYSVDYAKFLDEAWGSVTMGFPGELYANFGQQGVAVGFLLLGIIVVILDRLLGPQAGRTLSPLQIAIYSSMAIGFVRIFYGSTYGILVYHLIPIGVISVQMWLTARAIRIYKRITT